MEKKEEKKEEKVEEKVEDVDEDTEDMESDEEEEDIFEMITVDGVEYQHNKEDHTVIRVDDFEPVGKWNTESGEIDFDEEDDE